MPGDVVIEDQGLTKPGTVLIKKISDAVGGIAKPYQIVRVAKAEVKAGRIRTESEIELEDLRFRAASRFIEEETRKQLNMENITRKALPHLTDDASPEDMEDDWIANFFDKSRLVSDGDMQELWSRLLGGEANSPGTFSRKTVNILNDMEKKDAVLFQNLCSYHWTITGQASLMVFLESRGVTPVYYQNNIYFGSLLDLEAFGLIGTIHTGIELNGLPDRFLASHFGRSVEIVLAEGADSRLSIGIVNLTKSGQELSALCDLKPPEGFFEFICAKWEHDPRIESTRLL